MHRSILTASLSLSLAGCVPTTEAPQRPAPPVPAAAAPAMPPRPAPVAPEATSRSAPIIAHKLAAPAVAPKPAVKAPALTPGNHSLTWTNANGAQAYTLVDHGGGFWSTGNMTGPGGKGGGVFFVSGPLVVFRWYADPACTEFIQEFTPGSGVMGFPFDGSVYGFASSSGVGNFAVSP